MYKNVGEKIMALSQALGWLGLVAGIIIWIVLLINGNQLGWISLGGGVVSLFSSWFFYGFGQLVQDIHEQKDKTQIKPEQQEPASDELPDL